LLRFGDGYAASDLDEFVGAPHDADRVQLDAAEAAQGLFGV